MAMVSAKNHHFVLLEVGGACCIGCHCEAASALGSVVRVQLSTSSVSFYFLSDRSEHSKVVFSVSDNSFVSSVYLVMSGMSKIK